MYLFSFMHAQKLLQEPSITYWPSITHIFTAIPFCQFSFYDQNMAKRNALSKPFLKIQFLF